MLAFVPLLNDAVNFVLTPSNATVSVCAVPLPTEVILIAVKLAAFDADVANPQTDTTADDFRQDLEITVAKLTLFGKTKDE